MATGPGSASWFEGVGEARQIAWSVRWQSAEIEYQDDGRFGGTMEQVSGTLYEKGKVRSTFMAETAFADKATGILELAKQVIVTSPELKATLKCDQLVWASKEALVKANGKVTLENPGYRLGQFPELWASPDLKVVSTPDLFKKP